MEDVDGLFPQKAFCFLESLMKESVDQMRCEATPTTIFHFSLFTFHLVPKGVLLWNE